MISTRNQVDAVSLANAAFENRFQATNYLGSLDLEAFDSELILDYRTHHQSIYQASIHSRFHLQAGHVWIGAIFVSEQHRHSGIGRQLVFAIEDIAERLEMSLIRVLPTQSSVDFWRKLGFLPDPRAARILNKLLRKDSGYAPIKFNRST